MSANKEQRKRGLADEIIGNFYAKPTGRNKRRNRAEEPDPVSKLP